jgi:hypothetical protein
VHEGLGVGPATLALLSGQDGVVDCLLGFRASVEVVRENLRDLPRARTVQLLEREANGLVMLSPGRFEQARVDGLLSERMLDSA